MNYIKYFQNTKYEKGSNDCWTLVKDIFREEKNIRLPDCPIMTDYSNFETKLKSNFKYIKRVVPKEGCLIHFKTGKIEHIGYALNEKQYIHKTFTRVEISKIPKQAKIYEVFK